MKLYVFLKEIKPLAHTSYGDTFWYRLFNLCIIHLSCVNEWGERYKESCPPPPPPPNTYAQTHKGAACMFPFSRERRYLFVFVSRRFHGGEMKRGVLCKSQWLPIYPRLGVYLFPREIWVFSWWRTNIQVALIIYMSGGGGGGGDGSKSYSLVSLIQYVFAIVSKYLQKC